MVCARFLADKINSCMRSNLSLLPHRATRINIIIIIIEYRMRRKTKQIHLLWALFCTFSYPVRFVQFCLLSVECGLDGNNKINRHRSYFSNSKPLQPSNGNTNSHFLAGPLVCYFTERQMFWALCCAVCVCLPNEL